MKRNLIMKSKNIIQTPIDENMYRLDIECADDMDSIIATVGYFKNTFNQLHEKDLVEAYFPDGFSLYEYNYGCVLEYRDDRLILFNSYIPGLTPTMYLQDGGAIYSGPFKIYNRVQDRLMRLSVEELLTQERSKLERLSETVTSTDLLPTIKQIWKSNNYQVLFERCLGSSTTKRVAIRTIYDTLLEENSPIRVQKDLLALLCLVNSYCSLKL